MKNGPMKLQGDYGIQWEQDLTHTFLNCLPLWSCSMNTQKWTKGLGYKLLICRSLAAAWLTATPY